MLKLYKLYTTQTWCHWQRSGPEFPCFSHSLAFRRKAGVNLTAVLRSGLAHIDEPSATEAVAQIDLCPHSGGRLLYLRVFVLLDPGLDVLEVLRFTERV